MNRLLAFLYPRFIWKFPSGEKTIYLTFDDGPIPEVTPFVLDQLKQYNAKATFFCVGENILKHPDIFAQILQAGHVIGNHTYNHLNGWKTKTFDYLNNWSAFESVYQTALFRPPYGRILRKQARSILGSHKIIMWSVLTRDYSNALTPEQCLARSISKTRDGSIVLFHDSIKAEKNIRYVLPAFLEHFRQQGYIFKSIPDHIK